jgi:hypothetical protein
LQHSALTTTLVNNTFTKQFIPKKKEAISGEENVAWESDDQIGAARRTMLRTADLLCEQCISKERNI